ncbi:two-component system sensor histidine kinase NtrB [Kordiimonas aquimaris]|uniref:two-component system sensor histidine kinase NtrB n=1 Tax=Kordiimonas aquimaris TaxID=707591 RepID=UPI0021D0CA8E|nr:ATP-binding protein [Kordiimonas aquimaris]
MVINQQPDQDKHILNSLRQGVLTIDTNNCIAGVYAYSEAILGRSKESLLESELILLRGIGKDAHSLVNRAREENTPLNSYDVPVLQPLGDIELVDLQANPIDHEGTILLSILPRRITAFLEKRDDVEAAARSVSGLAAMLAHEVKNPLSGIRGAAQLMGRALDEKHARLPELICKEVDRIKDLVDNLENFNTSEQDDLEAVNIHEVLDHVLNLAAAGFASGATIRPRFDPSLPPVVGNYDRLVQIFLNLVKNAAEAAGENADITVSSAYRHGIWMRGKDGIRTRLPIEITIRDNGPGIPAAISSHLFDPFVSAKEGGAGLGLSLVARYISNFGGSVTADNHPEGGALFKVQLAMFEDAN